MRNDHPNDHTPLPSSPLTCAPLTLALTLVGTLSLCACGGLLSGPRLPSEPRWSPFSDQERLEVGRYAEGAVWGVAQGQLLAWRRDSGELHRVATAAPTTQVRDLWVERLATERLNERREALYQEALKAREAQQREAAASQEVMIDLEGLEIEGLEIEGDEGAQNTEGAEGAEGAEVDLDLSDVVIDTTTPASQAPTKLTPQSPQAKAPPPPPALPKVNERFRVYLATPKGLYAREVWLDAQWRDLLGEAPWRLLKPGGVQTLRPRLEGGAWWAGASGFGWVEEGKVGGRFGRVKARLAAAHPQGGAWVVLDDPQLKGSALLHVAPRLWRGGGEPLEVEGIALKELLSQMGPLTQGEATPCEGAPLDLTSTSKRALALCAPSEVAGLTLALWREKQGWQRFEGLKELTEPPRDHPQGGRLWAWGQAHLYLGARHAWVIREGVPTLDLSQRQSGEGAALVSALRRVNTPSKAGEQASQLYVEALTLDEPSPWSPQSAVIGVESSPQAPSDPTAPSPHWLAWSLPHEGLVVRRGAQGAQRQRLSTGSFAARNEASPYSLDPSGALWVPQARGAFVYTPQRGEARGNAQGGWRFVEAPEQGGRALGVAHCPEGSLWVMSRRPVSEGEESLMLELWPVKGGAPVASLDWREERFRRGEPKLGDVVCDAQGAISAALFWGQGWVGSGVGLLHIPAHRERPEIWTQRQGYDGEEELTSTPLLPDFTINALAARPDGGLYIATNSGLAVIGPPPASASEGAKGRRSVQVLSEATGWSTDFMNDLALGLDGRLWVATDQGLFALGQDLKPQLTTPRASMSAVGVDPNTGLIWVAIQDKLYRGDGRFETWERIKLTEGGLSGVVKRVLPFEEVSKGAPQGAAPFVWLATTRELLLGRP